MRPADDPPGHGDAPGLRGGEDGLRRSAAPRGEAVIARRALLTSAVLAAAGAVAARPGVARAASSRAAATAAAGARQSGPAARQITFDPYSLMIGGDRTFIWSGEFHPFRLPSPSLWFDVLQKMKASGYNAVSMYFNWSYHSPAPGLAATSSRCSCGRCRIRRTAAPTTRSSRHSGWSRSPSPASTFVLPTGILDPHGQNTLAIAVISGGTTGGLGRVALTSLDATAGGAPHAAVFSPRHTGHQAGP
jgi:hypothetical protein